jgi:hypothetical protein
MDWIAILVAGLSGAIAALIAALTVGFKTERRGLSAAITAILFVCIKLFASAYVEPGIRVWDTKRVLRTMPFYSELAAYDPETYQKVEAIVLEGVQHGDSQEKATLRAADEIMTILPKYIPKASNESVIAFVRWLLTSLDELNSANSDACYSFLYPHKFGEAGLANKYLPPKSGEQSLKVLEAVILSAARTPQKVPDERKADELMQPVITNLANKYGSDLKLVVGTAHDGRERKVVCEIDSELYKQILSLPPADASTVLRSLFSSKS